MKIALVGLESSGKTSIISGITDGKPIVIGSNVRGATAAVQEAEYSKFRLLDTPGIRAGTELVTSLYTHKTVKAADAIWVVVRGTNFLKEINSVFSLFSITDKPIGVVVSFKDKMNKESISLLENFKEKYCFPLLLVDGRNICRDEITELLNGQREISDEEKIKLVSLHMPIVRPREIISNNKWVKGMSALFLLLLSFILPVFLAYQFSGLLDPLASEALIQPIYQWLSGDTNWWSPILIGDYGLLSLGTYSFIWAFPVVLLFTLMVSIVDESGLKDRMTDALDPIMRHFHLTGQDLVPIISGFGCNVVALHESRSCQVCTRQTCVSVISFGSACSYQIGASLSIFGAAGKIELIVPYFLALGFFSLVHIKVWNRKRLIPIFEPHDTFLQVPSGRTIWFRMKPSITQFFLQAMPIFLFICIVASFLSILGWIDSMSKLAAPVLTWIGLPNDVSPAFISSILRKDGILLLNEGNGELISRLTSGQLFGAVYLCSTFSSCLVTMWKIAKELSLKEAFKIGGKQMVTSLVSAIIIVFIFQLVNY